MIYALVVCASTAPISGGCGVTDRSSTVCVEGKVAACVWSRRSAMKYALVYSPVLHLHGKISLRDAFKGSEAAL